MINLWWWWPWGRGGELPIWPAICRTSVIGPTGPIHLVSAVEVWHSVSEGGPVYTVSGEETVHSVTDGSPIHTVILTCE